MNQPFDLETYINHHLANSQEWHLPFLPTIHIPEPFSLHAFMEMIAATILIFVFGVLYNKKSQTPKGLTNGLESFVLFIRNDIVYAHVGKKHGRKLAPLFLTFFFFILTLNLMGLIPLFSTATANINVTAAFAGVTLFFMVFGTMMISGVGGFFKALSPSGVPVLIVPLLMALEFMGLIIKSIALMIRLFANMIAGHIVIMCLIALVILIGMQALPAVVLAVGIYVLELFVAFLQAYIFTLLSAMFIGHMVDPHH